MAMRDIYLMFVVAATCMQVAFSNPLQLPSIDGGLSDLPTGSGQPCLAEDLAERVRRQQVAQSLYPYQKVYAVQSFNYSTPDANSDALPNANCPMDGRGSPETCPKGIAPGHSGDVSKDSTCPFTYVTCYDPDRIPARLTVAQCECSACLDPYSNDDNADLVCQPVYYNIKVLRRKSCKNGMFHYEEQDERVPVACACMRRAVNDFNGF